MLKKVFVIIRNGDNGFFREVSEEIREHWEECSSNGANPKLPSWEHITRPIKTTFDKVFDYNGNHFIYGYLEALQTEMELDRKSTIEVSDSLHIG